MEVNVETMNSKEILNCGPSRYDFYLRSKYVFFIIERKRIKLFNNFQGLERTKRGKFEGGDTAWEEKTQPR